MQIVPLYAALLSFIFVFLSIKTISTRRSLKIGIGHANNEKMLRIMRVHSNFAEYVPSIDDPSKQVFGTITSRIYLPHGKQY